MDSEISRHRYQSMDCCLSVDADGGSGEAPKSDSDHEIRLIPLTSLDFYEVTNAILDKDSQAGLHILSDVWREALEAVYRQLRGRNVADGERWMAETLTQALRKNMPAENRLPL